MRARHLAGLLSLAALAASDLSAQQARKMPISIGLALNSVSIDRATADLMAVHDRAFGGSLDLGFTAKRYLFLAADFGYAGLSDHASFTQSTTGGDKKSSAGLVTFSALAGPRTPAMGLGPVLPRMSLSLLGGFTKTVGERSIDNCLDCQMDHLDIPGGAFVQPTVSFGSANTRLRLSHRQYLKGDGVRYLVSAGVEVGGR
ncbi:MAG TPA: hypothetical protein VFJ78_05310 [Gaiellaceae bacterium]|nr:hypothetical protein [Gaiellaceae bacterium]